MNQPLEPEYRRDPVTGRWVIVAPERSLRPMGLEGAEPRHRTGRERREPCPFCPGQEHDTPHEVLALRDPDTLSDGPGWRLRVVPNKFPAVRPVSRDLTPQPPSLRGKGEPEYSPPSLLGKGVGGLGSSRLLGVGRHEVVIECPEHLTNPARLTDDQFRDVLLAYRNRVIAHAADPALRYATVFKNVGAEAGASLGHCHSQIVATPFVPSRIQEEIDAAEAYFARERRCVFCDLLAAELADGSRVVAASPGFVALAAFAPRFAYELWVLPRVHASRYESLDESHAAELAGLMKRVVAALDVVLAEPAYNWVLHAGPLREAELPHYHWHFEIMPRTARPAGFEWGGGCFICSESPETAAAKLRDPIGPPG